jgi:membrane protease YdiL (CAAX protease family)
VPLVLIATALPSTFILWGEEFGWRGYLQTRLMGERRLLAAVVTGLIWGLWHAPFYFLPHYSPASQSWLTMPVFGVSTILLSILFGWLYERCASVWAVSLAHASVNCIGSTLTTLWLVGEPNSLVWSFLGVAGWVPLGILCGWVVIAGRAAGGE